MILVDYFAWFSLKGEAQLSRVKGYMGVDACCRGQLPPWVNDSFPNFPKHPPHCSVDKPSTTFYKGVFRSHQKLEHQQKCVISIRAEKKKSQLKIFKAPLSLGLTDLCTHKLAHEFAITHTHTKLCSCQLKKVIRLHEEPAETGLF